MSDHRRAPHNTAADPNVPPIMLLGAMASGDPSSPILEQEAAGQRQFVNSDTMPTNSYRSTDADLVALGFTLGEPVEGDPLFRYADLPPGWRREASDHDMWSYIVDEQGQRRVAVFYKAAFYDRKAHWSIEQAA